MGLSIKSRQFWHRVMTIKIFDTLLSLCSTIPSHRRINLRYDSSSDFFFFFVYYATRLISIYLSQGRPRYVSRPILNKIILYDTYFERTIIILSCKYAVRTVDIPFLPMRELFYAIHKFTLHCPPYSLFFLL